MTLHWHVWQKLSRDYADLCGITELREEVLAFFPGEAEYMNIYADLSHDVVNGRGTSCQNVLSIKTGCRFNVRRG